MYSTILFIHITTFIANISMVVIADFLGLLWVVGKLERLPRKFMLILHNLIWAGLSISIASGVYLFWPSREYLLTVESFYVKVGLVIALIINSFFIGKHLKTALDSSYKWLSKSEKEIFLSVVPYQWLVGWVLL